MNSAELALKSAKAAGGGTHRFCTSEMNATSVQLLTLENDLRRAIMFDKSQLAGGPRGCDTAPGAGGLGWLFGLLLLARRRT